MERYEIKARTDAEANSTVCFQTDLRQYIIKPYKRVLIWREEYAIYYFRVNKSYGLKKGLQPSVTKRNLFPAI
jgi:hypothetical protein